MDNTNEEEYQPNSECKDVSGSERNRQDYNHHELEVCDQKENTKRTNMNVIQEEKKSSYYSD